MRAWWWPAFGFTFPLLAVPNASGHDEVVRLHILWTAGFVAGGLILEAIGRYSGGQERRHTSGSVRRHVAVFAAFGFALWLLVSAAFSPNAVIALTGSPSDLSDGALFQVLLVGVFVLAYLQGIRDRYHHRKVAWAVVASIGVVALIAGVEVALHHSLIYVTSPDTLPVATFPQRGHLAGVLAMGAAIGFGLHAYPVAAFITVMIGLTMNRSASVAMIAVALLPWFARRPLAWRINQSVRVLVVVSVTLALGFVLVRKSPEGNKAIVDSGTVVTRTYYFKAALGGIAARPIFGWGGGNFQSAWPSFLSQYDLRDFAKAEWGFGNVTASIVGDAVPPILVSTEQNGAHRLLTVRSFKSHNELLEATLMWGIVGALLYVAVIVLSLQQLFRAGPLTWGIVAYLVFLLFWFVIPESIGTFWLLLGTAAAAGASQRYRGAAHSGEGDRHKPSRTT